MTISKEKQRKIRLERKMFPSNIVDILKETGISNYSIKERLRVLQEIVSKLDGRNDLKNKEKVMNAISHFKQGTQKTYLSYLKNHLEAVNIPLPKWLVPQIVEMNKEVKKETKKDTTQLKNKPLSNKASPQSKLIYHLYTAIPPRRVVDYSNMRVVDDESKIDAEVFLKHNWLDEQNLKFIFNDYKTSNAYGTQEIDIDEPTMELLIPVLQEREEGDYLLLTKDGEPMTANTLSVLIKKISGLSATQNRKKYIREHLSQEERDKSLEIAKKMGHSQDTQQTIYMGNMRE